MKNKEIKFGAILSYILVFANTFYGLLLTPYILGQIGNSEFGVYKAIGSITATMMILDLGIGGTIQRYIAKFRAENQKDKINNFFAMSIVQTFFIIICLILLSIPIYFSINSLYENSFTSTELIRAKQLFLLLIISVCFNVIDRVFQGVMFGHNRFIFVKWTKLSSIIIRSILLFAVLPFYKNSITLVMITIILDILVTIASIFYISKKLKVKAKLTKWDKHLFIDSLGYTVAIFIQSIMTQLNLNFDNAIIGAIKGTELVTIYSFGLLVYNLFVNLSSTISELLLPTVTNILHSENSKEKLEKLVLKIGRIQYMLLGAAFFGFIFVGKEFIELWLGPNFKDVWVITLILMIPAIWELTTNTFLAILRAKKQLKYRTIILVIGALFNLVTTILGVMWFGYLSAAIVTALTSLLVSIAMNIYYYKVLHINSFSIFMKIIFPITLCFILPSFLIYLMNIIMNVSWVIFLVKVLVFCVFYALILYFFGLNKSEKDFFFKRKGTINNK